ncbi:CsbD family protein [Methylobacterium nonmethylotrophicum]|uniref:CsbD family protein n=1 Tax=Methylobacterium nonmethylotrophicum TaxID=1141884 RepID=A0A4Z0NFD1_9HYPH|nr:CsbD family protein [Methylobacterium nonmethylotrophicum]TGD94228.1 CsbD family protein [Methylobacterium nonmethylotrophicum]
MDSDRITGAGRELGGKAQQRIGEWTGDAGTQAQGFADQATGAARNAYGQAKDAVRGLADAAPDYADQAREAGRHYYERGNRAVARQVGDQHLAALLVAGAVGYLFGWLIHGRH